MLNQFPPGAKSAKTAKSQNLTSTPHLQTPMHYSSRISAAMDALALPPGSVLTLRVHHDTECPLLAGKPDCQCAPDIYIDTDQGRVEVMPDGSLRQLAALN
jgi:hypothetical protein